MSRGRCAAVTLIGLLLLTACSDEDVAVEPCRSSTAAAPAVPEDVAVLDTVEQRALAVEVTDGVVTAVTADSTLVRMEGGGDVGAPVQLPGLPYDLATAGGVSVVGVADDEDGTRLVRVDGAEVEPLDLAIEVPRLASGCDRIWVRGDRDLAELDADGSVIGQEETESTAPEPGGVGEGVWIGGGGARVVALDGVDAPGDELEVESFDAPVEGPSGVWLNGGPGGEVTLVDPASLEVVRSASLGAEGVRWSGAVAEGLGALWVGDADGVVWVVDPDTLEVVADVDVGAPAVDLAVADDRIWVATGEALVAIGPAEG